MAWQPLLPNQPVPDEERLIATGGEDCAILIWNARRPESKAKCFLTMDSPIVRLAFTPDGAFIAGATSRQVLIWKVDNHSIPRASWNRPPHPAWLSPKGSTETDEEDEHCLCWDVSGQKLAYGSNSRVSFFFFPFPFFLFPFSSLNGFFFLSASAPFQDDAYKPCCVALHTNFSSFFFFCSLL